MTEMTAGSIWETGIFITATSENIVSSSKCYYLISYSVSGRGLQVDSKSDTKQHFGSLQSLALVFQLFRPNLLIKHVVCYCCSMPSFDILLARQSDQRSRIHAIQWARFWADKEPAQKRFRRLRATLLLECSRLLLRSRGLGVFGSLQTFSV